MNVRIRASKPNLTRFMREGHKSHLEDLVCISVNSFNSLSDQVFSVAQSVVNGLNADAPFAKHTINAPFGIICTQPSRRNAYPATTPTQCKSPGRAGRHVSPKGSGELQVVNTKRVVLTLGSVGLPRKYRTVSNLVGADAVAGRRQGPLARWDYPELDFCSCFVPSVGLVVGSSCLPDQVPSCGC